MQQRNGVW